MTCLECGREQEVADAGTCAGCGAPLPGGGHRSETFTGPDGAELRADGNGIDIRGAGDAPARRISWGEIGWFRDGWHAPGSKKSGWMLHIVLADGRVDQVAETWAAGRAQAPPELLALIRQAAAARSVPAVLTGGEVHAGLPGDDIGRGKPGLYCDPAGKPGLREWTGTEWSPFLQVDPAASGHQGQATGLARTWSPLSPEELHRHSGVVRNDVQLSVTAFPGCLAFLTLVLAVIAVLMASGHLHGASGPTLAAVVGVFWAIYLAASVSALRDAPRRKRIAQALSAAATRVLAQDDPPAPIEPPGSRTG
jgi:hypothetical protein